MRIYLVGAYLTKQSKPTAVKIGVSQDMNARLKDIQLGNHLECRVLATWIVESPRKAFDLEAKAHKRFKSSRIRGEWFRPRVGLYVEYFNSMIAIDRDHIAEIKAARIEANVDREMLAEHKWLTQL